jgi:hypothetical protein
MAMPRNQRCRLFTRAPHGADRKESCPCGTQGAAIALVIVAILALPPLVRAAEWSIDAGRTDSRYAALDWIEANVPVSARVAREWHTPPLRQAGYDELFILKTNDNPLEWYRAAGVEYLVLSSFMYQRYLDAPEQYPTDTAFYQRLLAVPRQATFAAENGPVIVVLRLDDAAPAFSGGAP